MDTRSIRVKNAAGEDFSKYKVDGLKNFLKERGIQLSDGGKGKRKAELVDLCEKAAEMKQAKLEDTVEDYNKLLAEKLQTEDGKLSDPKTLTGWTNSFSNIPEFTFGDLYNYLVGSEEYSEENLRSFKSLLGYKLYRDGHVTDLKCCPVENRKFFFFKFKVKPTERAKTEDGQTTYNGFIICEWKRRSGNSDYATPLKDLRIVKAEFGKSEKNLIKPHDFHPGLSSFDPVSMREKLRRGLQQLHPESVAIQFLPKRKDPVIPEPVVAEHVSNNANVKRFETVESVSVYTMKEYAEIFKCQNNISINGDISEETRQSFIKFVTVDKNQCDMICLKTIDQGSSQFWYDQRSGRITASNFYRVCHMRESTEKSNVVKLLMNYCPMEHVPEQLQWGHEKEIAASDLYLKKNSKKHNEVRLIESGLIINQKWPFLGASPDRIRRCKCHGKTLVECKSLFAKRNLLPGVAASDKLFKTTTGFKLKEETSWYYQIQGQMGISGIHATDLVIYTNKGILIVHVEFNAEFWQQILDKLKLFFAKFMVPELLTGKILCEIRA